MKLELRSRLVDSPASLGATLRLRRWERFTSLFPDIADMKVLDVGGTTESWLRAPVRPAHVVVLNLTEPGDGEDGWLTPVAGDACDARSALEHAGAPVAYDLVFSNSLLEHVGGHAQRSRLAEQIRQAAPRHWVQTPYRYFPIEPHWLFPGMQFLPMALRARVAERWPLVHTLPASRAEAMADVQWTELVGRTEMRSYFPDSEVLSERLLGLTKSMIAVRTR
ncbi:hypothetical protein ACFV9G_24570 [Nocardioides sp. NPDC059952]|uniref:hypothetical protein n=1 Tax=Nocardioides sp. NPDC059952 TaxID=3347014 RepID=UPI003647BDA5